ncbi:aquaporin [Kluyvera ascorbata]|uniref:aquaporin n=1 Tax=Kluyvera ascorbata TaxID=51288 RepID=UPI0039F6F527
MFRKLAAECFGTFWLVFGGCGSAVLAAAFPELGIGFAGVAIGLALTLIHLISIPVTNTSVNPARSTAVAIFQGGWALHQLWLFWVMPIIGGILGGLIYRTLLEKK